MSEIINIYTRENPGKSIPFERSLFYDEEIQRSKSGLPVVRYIEVVNIFLFTESGELIIQKRSKEKRHNANLLDKSIGGHVQNGDSPNLTAMIETIQELQVPSIVLGNNTDFMRTFSVLSKYINTSALLEYVSSEYMDSEKIFDGEKVTIGNLAHIYFGIYWWPVKNIDKEAKGILYYTLEDLLSEMEEHPNIFTPDLCTLVPRYTSLMRDFLTKLWH